VMFGYADGTPPPTGGGSAPARAHAAAALAAGTAIVAALYLGLNMVFIFATRLRKHEGRHRIGAFRLEPVRDQNRGTFSALMALSIISTVNAMVTIGPRVYYAMAKNKAFFRAAASVDARWHTPVNAFSARACAPC